jgi:hypothetical protein
MRTWVSLSVLLVAPALALGVTVEGTRYPDTVTVEGHTLNLVGAGLREKWFFDVYTMGAYTPSGKCDTRAIIKDEEVKYLRLDMHRDVSAEKMSSTIGESFEQRKTFEGYFKDECSEGTVLEFVYVPGTGTILKQNGKKLGPPIEGKAFQEVLWDIYFGKDTCCEDLLEQILETCKKK